MADLETALRQEAEAEIQAIRNAAEAEAQTILAAAEAEAQSARKARERALAQERERTLRAAESARVLELSTARARARGEVIEEVRLKTLEALEKIPARKEYPRILTKLADQALAATQAPERVEAAPQDLVHLEAWAKSHSLELNADPALQLGVRLIGNGGRSRVENTLPGRLARSWEGLSAQVAAELFG